MVGAFFTMLFAKIAAALAWFGALFVAVFVGLWALGKDGVCWVFEQGITLATSIIAALDISGIPGASSFGAIPADIGNVLSVLGVGTAITMITAALTIRFTLQLIPFVRLGS